MTTEARTARQTAADICKDLQLALADAKMTFPELSFSDTAEGDVRITLGRVGIRRAARPARTLKAARA